MTQKCQKMCACVITVVLATGILLATQHSPTASANGTGSGSVEDDTISAEVRFDSPPAESGCSWEKVRGSQPLPVAGTNPVQYETLYYRVCDDRVMAYTWIRDSTPKRIAESAHNKVSRLVNALAIRTAPPSDKMVVTVGTWFWVPRTVWKPISVTAWIVTQAGPISVTTTATPTTLTYSPGDGQRPVTCNGPGRQWSTQFGDRAKTSCMYTYTRASHSRAQQRYRANLAVTWRVTWRSSVGLFGRLPNIRIGTALPVTVLELQALSR